MTDEQLGVLMGQPTVEAQQKEARISHALSYSTHSGHLSVSACVVGSLERIETPAVHRNSLFLGRFK